MLHHYTECGLDNIYVDGLSIEDDHGDEYIIIPAIQELHALIAHILVHQKKQLSGKEFDFLRGEVGMSIKKVAQKIDVSVKILEQWEQHNEIAQRVERAFRSFVLKSLLSDATLSASSSKIDEQERVTIQYDSDDKKYSLVAA